MQKTLIIYYSRTGNNKFIAEKLGKDLNSEVISIETKSNNLLLLIFATVAKANTGIIQFSKPLENYERIILLAPIWMGSLISPIRGFLNKYKNNIKDFTFITVCGGDVEDKDTKFGYEKVFKEVNKYFSNKRISCYAISTKSLSRSENSKEEPIISEELFTDQIKKRYDEVLKLLKNLSGMM